MRLVALHGTELDGGEVRGRCGRGPVVAGVQHSAELPGLRKAGGKREQVRVDRLIGLHVGGRRIHDGRVEAALAFGSKLLDGLEGGEVLGVEGLFFGLDDRLRVGRLDSRAGTHVGHLVVAVIEEGTIGIRPDVLVPPGGRMTNVGCIVRTSGGVRREFALRIRKG